MTEHEVIDSVKRTIESALKIPFDRIDEEAEFRSFGMDSIIAMEVMSKLSKTFNIKMSPAVFAQVGTVRELASRISESCGREAGVGAVPAMPSPTAAAVPEPGTIKPVARRPLTGQRRERRSISARSDAVASMIDKVRQKYSIDLDGRFSSVADVIDRLVTNHSDRLLDFYSRQPGPFQARVATLARSGDSGARQSAASVARSLDVAIIGIACRFPDADDTSQFWINLLNGKSSIRDVPMSRWSTRERDSDATVDRKPLQWAALIDGVDRFDPAFFSVPKAVANLIDPQERLLLQELYRAMQDACLDPTVLAGSNTGVFVGHGQPEYAQQLGTNRADGSAPGLASPRSAIPNHGLANRLSCLFDLRGPSESMSVGNASSALAVKRAHASLVLGECDLAVAAGVSLDIICDDEIASSQQNHLSPTGTCAVFDDAADGCTRGEGVGVLILKRLEDAERDNDRIYAVIKACRHNNPGRAEPNSGIDHRSITGVIRECQAMAAVPAESVKYVELNGYATKWADALEFEGVKNAFADDAAAGRKHCAVGSLKGNIGHLQSASGIAALIKLALAMHNRVFPPTTTIRRLNEFIHLDAPSHPLFLADTPIAFDDLRSAPRERILAGINSFADDGTNVHLLLEEYPAEAVRSTGLEPGKPELFVLSARNDRALLAAVEQFADFLVEHGSRLNFTDLIYSLQVGREAMECRLAVIASSTRELADKVQRLRLSGLDAVATLQQHGIYCPGGRGPETPRGGLDQLISRPVADMQLRLSRESRQWHEVALLWTNGLDLSWRLIWDGRAARPVSLPGYPFAGERCWIDQIEADRLPSLDAGGLCSFLRNRPRPGSATTAVEGPAVDAVTRIWSRVLGIDAAQVDVGRSFFELGGNPQSALRLLSEINRSFGAALCPADLLDSPFIADMARRLEERSAPSLAQFAQSAGHDLVVAIQSKGTRPPVFGLPGAGGSVLCLQALSQALGRDQPFYGLQSVGLDGASAPLSSVEGMAEAAIAAARGVQAQGPYHLIGYSNGGVIAFEMAQRLIASGDEVASLVMIDSVSPLQRINNVVEEMVKVCNDLLKVLGSDRRLDVSEFEHLQPDLLMQHLHGVLTKEGFDLSSQQFATSFGVIMASDNACRIYRPRACDGVGRAHLFRATNGYPELPPDYGWGALLPGRLEVHEIQADHLSIITGEPIRKIARKLGRILRRSEAAVALSAAADEDGV